MVIKELLTERVHDVVYHYTNMQGAAEILKTWQFKLSSTVGSSYENTMQPSGYPFFFSTSRSRAGGYHEKNTNDGVVFKLNGDWFNRHYRSAAVDYWGRNPNRTSEQEDRVFSEKSSIPADAITEIHVLVGEVIQNPDLARLYGQLLRHIRLIAKRRGIPLWGYANPKNWLLQNKSRALSSKQLNFMSVGTPATRKDYGSSNYLADWLELWHKKNTADLSPRAAKLLYNVKYQWRPQDVLGLDTDLSNERKPASSNYDTANKIIEILQRNRYTLPDFVKALKSKWRIIDLADHHGITPTHAKNLVLQGIQHEIKAASHTFGTADALSMAEKFATENLWHKLNHYHQNS